MFKCAKTTCFRPVDNGGLHCRKHGRLEILKLGMILVGMAVLVYLMSGCAIIPHTQTTIECFRGDVKGTYSSNYESKNGCGVKVEKNGLLDEAAARVIKTILEASVPMPAKPADTSAADDATRLILKLNQNNK